jgi:hypothetical protein
MYNMAMLFSVANEFVAHMRSRRTSSWEIYDQRAVVRMAGYESQKIATAFKTNIFEKKSQLYFSIFDAVRDIEGVQSKEVIRALIGDYKARSTDQSVRKFQDNIFRAMISNEESVNSLLDIWYPTTNSRYKATEVKWDAELYKSLVQFLHAKSDASGQAIIGLLADYIQALFYNEEFSQLQISSNQEEVKFVKAEGDTVAEQLRDPAKSHILLDRLGKERSEQYHGLRVLELSKATWEKAAREGKGAQAESAIKHYTEAEQKLRRETVRYLYLHIMSHLPDDTYTDEMFQKDCKLLHEFLVHAAETITKSELDYLQFSPYGVEGDFWWQFVQTMAAAAVLSFVLDYVSLQPKAVSATQAILGILDHIKVAVFFPDLSLAARGMISGMLPGDLAYYAAVLKWVTASLGTGEVAALILKTLFASPPKITVRTKTISGS